MGSMVMPLDVMPVPRAMVARMLSVPTRRSMRPLGKMRMIERGDGGGRTLCSADDQELEESSKRWKHHHRHHNEHGQERDEGKTLPPVSEADATSSTIPEFADDGREKGEIFEEEEGDAGEVDPDDIAVPAAIKEDVAGKDLRKIGREEQRKKERKRKKKKGEGGV